MTMTEDERKRYDESVSEWLDAIDERIDAMGQQGIKWFDTVNERLDAIDKRIDGLEARINAWADEMIDDDIGTINKRIDQHSTTSKRIDTMNARIDACERHQLGIEPQ